MIAHVNFKSGVPVYQQILQQVKAATACGVLRPGEALPSVRALAEALRINRNTAARAYAALEAEGVIETRQGAGCFVRANGVPSLRRAVRADRLSAELDAVIVQAHHLQIDDRQLKALLEERLEAFRERQHAPAVS
ncbi:MAG: GntR family transcriptional regulator [Verrucomicrobiae bacterium]|nr:GntR family transcriptional regulator [Verrucomicrobiae bacterium]